MRMNYVGAAVQRHQQQQPYTASWRFMLLAQLLHTAAGLKTGHATQPCSVPASSLMRSDVKIQVLLEQAENRLLRQRQCGRH
eukprot:353438-Chlamydomonas_euryale.AAC.11